MAIRITGMYSGLDTESIINELASAQSYKKNKLVKAQTKLSWKQDAWKALNTKIYSFYTKLDDLRMQSSYMKKKTTVSNPNAIQVTGGQVDGTHSVKVTSLSKRAAITSGKLNAGKNYNYTANATLKQLGFTGSGTIHISDNNGESIDIDVNENMKINDFVKAITDNTSLSASYDQENQRIYIGSWTSGEAGNFYLSGNDAGGMEALKALKLISAEDIDKITGAGGEYETWASYRAGSATGTPSQAYLDLIREETLARLKALKAQNDKLEQANKDYDEANKKNVDMLKEIQSNTDGKYDDYTGFIDSSYDFDTMTAADIKAAGEKLYDEIYGKKTTRPVQAKDENGNLLYETDGSPKYVQAKDEDGNLKFETDGTPVYETETVRTGGMKGKLEELQGDLKTEKEALEQARKDLEADPTNTGLQDAVKAAEKKVADASKAVSDQQTKISKAEQVYSFYDAYKQNDDKKLANQETIKKNNDRFTYSKVGDVETYMEKDASGNEVAVGTGLTAGEVTAEFDKKVAIAQDVMNNAAKWKSEAQATKVVGKDSEIEVDGVTYSSYNDTVTVNGMTITAMETTDKEVTVATKDDTDGIYEMIKDFIKSYSELINEMDSLYNAEAAKDYEPLLSEEKDALTDSEVEEWEKKIKDSLLRRDSTLSDIGSAMKMTMMQGIKIGGVNFYLSDFGINTLGYFNSKDNEKNAYHIDGDPDDVKTKNNTDMLREAITKNPDAVMEFFTGLTNNLHDTLAEKMSATKMSSALTFYNDKKMKEDYDDYTDKIKKQEEKLNAYIDKWYAKFSAMETALAKLESKNSSLSSLFGG
ncbi:MAG: flagellar filament capping protein FliD [Lachnospiraceae bacterium]|nr:flagellar filament capping protein FliD [Lachnospiraceae bacterium]